MNGKVGFRLGDSMLFSMLFPRGGDIGICGGDLCILGEYGDVVGLIPDGGCEV